MLPPSVWQCWWEVQSCFETRLFWTCWKEDWTKCTNTNNWSRSTHCVNARSYRWLCFSSTGFTLSECWSRAQSFEFWDCIENKKVSERQLVSFNNLHRTNTFRGTVTLFRAHKAWWCSNDVALMEIWTAFLECRTAMSQLSLSKTNLITFYSLLSNLEKVSVRIKRKKKTSEI